MSQKQSTVPKILLVEHDAAIADLVASLLNQEDYQVTIASSGAEGLGPLKEHSYSLVLVDAILPDINGYQVCRSVKSHLNITQAQTAKEVSHVSQDAQHAYLADRFCALGHCHGARRHRDRGSRSHVHHQHD